jgi:hypothetical protein
MITNIPTPQRTNNKVIGEFYPLQKDELIALRQAKLINNAAFVHLALRYENPFCDRPVEILPKEFALRWSIPESSVYEAIGRLKKLGVLLVKTGKVIVEWVKDKINIPLVDLSQESNSENQETLQDSRIHSEVSEDLWDSGTNSEMSEKILRSQNNLRDPIINSEMSENRSLKPLSIKDSDSLQTIQTIQTNQTGAVVEKKLKNQNLQLSTEGRESGKSKNLEVSTKEQVKEDLTSKLKHLSDSLARPKSCSQDKTIPQDENNSQISAEVKAKLEKLNIPLDSKVSKAIASHHVSQVKGAIAHIENTWESIKNPQGVFLYQLPKQPIEVSKNKRRHLTAADFGGYTIEHLKNMYPTNWREAAIHFGLEVPEQEKM